MKRILFLVLLFITYLAKAGSFYWVGGSGSWSSITSWSQTSGGSAGLTIPSVGDTVYFNGGSGLNGSSVVTLDVAIDVAIFDFSAANTAFQFQCALPSISISNILSGSANPTFTGWTGFWNITTNTTGSIISNGRVWSNDIKMTGTGVLTASVINSTADLYLNSGTLNLSGSNSTIANFYSLTATPRNINLSNAIITLSGPTWNVNAINFSIVHTNSRINLNNAGTTVFTGVVKIIMSFISILAL